MSGYIKTAAQIFRFDTISNEIEECLSDNLGAVYNGETEFVHDMMCSVASYRNISPKDAVQLVSTVGKLRADIAARLEEYKSETGVLKTFVIEKAVEKYLDEVKPKTDK